MSAQSIIRSPVVSFGLAIFGAIGVLYTVYAGETAKQYGIVRYRVVSQVVYDPVFIRDFNETVASTKIDPSKKLYLSEITLWNAGNQSFEPRDARSPVELSGDSSFKIIKTAIINSKSATSDNFTALLRDNSKIILDWKVFDPEDGFKIALLHNGDPEAISVNAKFGPGRSISAIPSHPATGLVTFLGGALIFFFYVTFFGIKATNWAEERLSGFANFAAFMTVFFGGIAISCAIVWGCYRFYMYYNGEVAPLNDKLETRIDIGSSTSF